MTTLEILKAQHAEAVQQLMMYMLIDPASANGLLIDMQLDVAKCTAMMIVMAERFYGSDRAIREKQLETSLAVMSEMLTKEFAEADKPDSAMEMMMKQYTALIKATK